MMSVMLPGWDRFVVGRTGIALVVAMTVAIVSQAQTPVKPPGGGTIANPYQISQLGHLAWMSGNVYFSKTYYKLMNDIDASATVNWNGGTGFSPIYGGYNGGFDGNGKAIRNLTINARFDKLGVGFFEYLDTGWVVKNLSLVDVLVAGGYNSVGGLVGFNYGTVSGCFVSGSVTAGSGGTSAVGGLVGFNYGTISECAAIGSVKGVWASSDDVGGLVGNNLGTIINCYSTASVTGDRIIGGLVGYNDSALGSVTRCYSSGRVTGILSGTYTGGLVGYISFMPGGPVTASYWDIQSSGQSISDGGMGRTTGQMKQQATYTGWDFITVWGISENMLYPFLRSHGMPLGALAHASPTQSFLVSAPATSWSWSFVYNYTTASQVAAKAGLTAGAYDLNFNITKPSTCVGYLFDASAGRYVEAIAYIYAGLN